jgi:predicted nuclease of predicted toxin-antitoxin system
MSLSFVIDVNLSPYWASVLTSAGYSAVHWSAVGQPGDKDSVVIAWAVANRHVVFTGDLDFGSYPGTTKATEPSVVQLRGEDKSPVTVGAQIVALIRGAEQELLAGAIIVIDLPKSHARTLPL